jgi:hypothetical protein
MDSWTSGAARDCFPGADMGESLLLEQSISLADTFSSNLRDMVGVEAGDLPESLVFGPFDPIGSMTVLIHFTGAISGEYAISLDERVASSLLGMEWTDSVEARKESRRWITVTLLAMLVR